MGIIRSIKFRDNLYNTSKETPPNTIDYWNIKQKLVTYNCILKRSIRAANVAFYKTKFEQCKSDLKKTWTIISNIIKSNKKQPIPEHLKIINYEISEKTILANKFNEYFGQTGSHMAL